MNTYPLSEEGVTEALAVLGRNPEDIAANLVRLSIKGERWSDSNDWISNYLRSVLPPIEGIWVWAHDIRIEWIYSDEVNGPTLITTVVFCTPAQGAFIEGADEGLYPELIEIPEGGERR